MDDTQGFKKAFQGLIESDYKKTDQIFLWLLPIQWVFEILISLLISPKTWAGSVSNTHIHVWAAIFLGGTLTLFPVFLIRVASGSELTRHTVGIAQALTSALLVHLTGGRIETHFHIFGSLAFLSFYKDYRVLLSASAVIAADHFLRGIYWPQSIYGVMFADFWRPFEHVGWVVFENIFLIISCVQSRRVLLRVAKKEVSLVSLNSQLQFRVNEAEGSREALRKSEARNQRLLESNIIGIFFADLSGNVLECNSTFLKLTGSTRTSLPLKKETLQMLTNREIGQLVMTGTCGPGEKDIKRVDGSVVPVMLGGALLETQEDRCVCFVLDLTEQKKLEKKYLQSQKVQAIGRLAGGIAHDFNNLLAVIMGNADLLLASLKQTDPNHEVARVIFEASKSGAGLTRQLLTFSRQQVLQIRAMNINNTLTRMRPILEQMVTEEISLSCNLASDLALTEADENQLEQVILNLLANARDAIAGRGRVEIRTSNTEVNREKASQWAHAKPGKYVLISVSDSGQGMNQETINQIFEPFFTTKQAHKGTGLGLATVMGIIEQCHGMIDVTSEVGKGSTFLIYLPATQKSAEALEQGQTENENPPLGWETVLLVEDKILVRKMAAQMLFGLGYQVIEADSPTAAESEMAKVDGKVDLVLTDVIMPEKSGVTMMNELLARYSPVRVVFMSGHTDNAVLPSELGGFPTKFVSKPFTLLTLAKAIRESLDWRP